MVVRRRFGPCTQNSVGVAQFNAASRVVDREQSIRFGEALQPREGNCFDRCGGRVTLVYVLERRFDDFELGDLFRRLRGRCGARGNASDRKRGDCNKRRFTDNTEIPVLPIRQALPKTPSRAFPDPERRDMTHYVTMSIEKAN